MFINVFRGRKNERIGLLLAAVIFGLVAIMQLWRAFTGLSVEFGGHTVPIWLSAIAGTTALLMSFWMALILHRHRPIL
jgi:hypothetical protein